MLGSSSFKWAQTHLCRPSSYRAYWLFVPYSRVLRYRALQPSSVRRESYTERSLPPWKLEWYWSVVYCRSCFLCILPVKNVVGISLANILRKNNTLHHYSTPYPPSSVLHLATIWLQALTSKYSNCISYNFFIFCPICMKFSHNILHTYSFILSIIKHNWKIRRFWVADPLNFLKATTLYP